VIDLIAGRHGIGMAPASVRFPDEQAGMMGVMWIRLYIRTADVAEVGEVAKIVDLDRVSSVTISGFTLSAAHTYRGYSASEGSPPNAL
jgi:hypothetical protein